MCNYQICTTKTHLKVPNGGTNLNTVMYIYKITKYARSDWPRGVFAWEYVNMVVWRKDTRVANTPLPVDWSVEKSHCQINVVGRHVLISKMNFFIFSRVVVFRGSYFIKAIETFFLCLHSLIWTLAGLGEFETVMQSRDEVFILGYTDKENVFYCLSRNWY